MLVRSILSLFILFSSCVTKAEEIGLLLFEKPTKWELNIDYKSDIWRLDDSEKDEIVRNYDIRFKSPVYNFKQWQTFFQITNESLSLGPTDLSLGEKRIYSGSHFRIQEIGVGVQKAFADKSSLVLFTNIASANSNSFFNEDDENWIEFYALYSFETSSGRPWFFFVDYTKNRGFLNNYPFLLVGTKWESTENLELIYGFLFIQASWDSQHAWSNELRLTPFDFSYTVSKEIFDDFLYEARASYEISSYLDKERSDDDLRLTFHEAAVENSLIRRLSENTLIRYGIGYSFYRSIYESKNIYKAKSKSLDLAPDFFLRAHLEFKL